VWTFITGLDIAVWSALCRGDVILIAARVVTITGQGKVIKSVTWFAGGLARNVVHQLFKLSLEAPSGIPFCRNCERVVELQEKLRFSLDFEIRVQYIFIHSIV
jgi:hypothetical protein